MLEFSYVVIYFLLYSVLGWLCEVVYCSLRQKKLVNRGMLYGPLCPIYGLGALLIVFVLDPLPKNVILIFLAGLFLTSSLEYAASYLLEKIFNMKWWDYSHYKLNINGRVCFLNSLMFGLLCVLLIFGIHPLASTLINQVNESFIPIFAFGLLAVFLTDLGLTVASLIGLKAQITKSLESFQSKLAKFKYRHFLSKFPDIKHTKYRERFEDLKERLSEYIAERKRSK